MIESFNRVVDNVRSVSLPFTVAWLILTLTACDSNISSSEWENRVSDTESRIFTHTDNRRRTIRDYNICLDHLGNGNKQIEIMLEGDQKRLDKNIKEIEKELEKRNEQLQKLDDAKVREANNGGGSVGNSYSRKNENEFLDLDSALVRSANNRNN